jgi:hypothetical protein
MAPGFFRTPKGEVAYAEPDHFKDLKEVLDDAMAGIEADVDTMHKGTQKPASEEVMAAYHKIIGTLEAAPVVRSVDTRVTTRARTVVKRLRRDVPSLHRRRRRGMRGWKRCSKQMRR